MVELDKKIMRNRKKRQRRKELFVESVWGLKIIIQNKNKTVPRFKPLIYSITDI